MHTTLLFAFREVVCFVQTGKERQHFFPLQWQISQVKKQFHDSAGILKIRALSFCKLSLAESTSMAVN